MIDVVASGVGATQDLATFDAFRAAVRDQTRVMVRADTTVKNGKLVESIVMTRSAGYVTRYSIQEVKEEGGRYVVRVVATVNEIGLLADLHPPHDPRPESIDGALLAAAQAEQETRVSLAKEAAADWDMQVRSFLNDVEARKRYRWTVVGVWKDSIGARCKLPHELASGIANVYGRYLANYRPSRDGWGDLRSPLRSVTVRFLDAAGTTIDTAGTTVDLSDDSNNFRETGELGIDIPWSLPTSELARLRSVQVEWADR